MREKVLFVIALYMVLSIVFEFLKRRKRKREREDLTYLKDLGGKPFPPEKPKERTDTIEYALKVLSMGKPDSGEIDGKYSVVMRSLKLPGEKRDSIYVYFEDDKKPKIGSRIRGTEYLVTQVFPNKDKGKFVIVGQR